MDARHKGCTFSANKSFLILFRSKISQHKQGRKYQIETRFLIQQLTENGLSHAWGSVHSTIPLHKLPWIGMAWLPFQKESAHAPDGFILNFSFSDLLLQQLADIWQQHSDFSLWVLSESLQMLSALLSYPLQNSRISCDANMTSLWKTILLTRKSIFSQWGALEDEFTPFCCV